MNIDAIRRAAERLQGHSVITPLLNAPLLDEIAGRRIFVKAECLQKTGSFKYRGARSAISALAPEIRTKGILAFSSGNHAQGIAYAAREMGVPSAIVMPEDAPKAKIENTRSYGAEVALYDRATGDREAIGAALADERGMTLIKPFDDPQVIAGQGTCGLEIAAQAKAAGVTKADVLICCGGGGLTAGIAAALEVEANGLLPRPVEPVGFDDVTRSLATGKRQKNAQTTGSICDAILTPTAGDLTFPIIQRICAPGVVVSDQDALRAMALAYRFLKIVLEPGGAVALAAALFHRSDDQDVIAVASGGNVDARVFHSALAVPLEGY